LPELVLTVCGSLPYEVVVARIDGEFDYRQAELDPVLRMLNAWEVDEPVSRQVYREFHRDWEQGYQDDTDLLGQVSPDLVLADIPYRILSAAAQLGIPAIGMCSLNWADIYAAYCEGDRTDRQILAEMIAGYRAAHTFLTPQPAIPMPQLDNICSIGPIARLGTRQKATLCEQCGVSEDVNIVLVALGGIATDIPLDLWPQLDNTVWLFTTATGAARHDCLETSALALPFIDVLASVDVVLTKPGYGTYTEAVCNAVPVLSIERPDWPETAVLNRWVQQHGHLELMTREQFYQGTFAPQVRALLGTDAGPGMQPTGISQAAGLIRSLLPVAGHTPACGQSA